MGNTGRVYLQLVLCENVIEYEIIDINFKCDRNLNKRGK